MRNLSLAGKIALLFITFCTGVALVIAVRALWVMQEKLSLVDPVASRPPIESTKAQEYPDPGPTPENTSLADKPSQYLCDHLVEMKEMAWDPRGFSNDPIYDGLKRKGFDAVPCLIEKITDIQPTENSTGAPFWAGLTYRVGDDAVNMLMTINDMYWPKGMLPKKYEKMFKDEGMFSYYFYVDEVPGARKQVQRWWRNWLKNLPAGMRGRSFVKIAIKEQKMASSSPTRIVMKPVDSQPGHGQMGSGGVVA
jgi:hypothetical protein